MAIEKLDFTQNLKGLEKEGDSFVVSGEYQAGQIHRALYFHGKRHGRKYKSMKIASGYMIVLAEINE